MNTPKQFDEYRHKLTELTETAESYVAELEQDDDFKNYVGRAPDEIRYSLKILKQNVFPIALFAKMQSGKSTTTAAMTDGREITPCGKGGGGLRTSTVSVTIYNDDNVQDVEVEINGQKVRTTPVEMNLYSNRDLVQCIIDAAGGNLKTADLYDLDRDEDRALLKKAVEMELELYKNSPENYPIDKIADLREAILILAFYGCDAHKKLCSADSSTLAKIQPSSNDPQNNWDKFAKYDFDKIASNFTAEESLYVFVNDNTTPAELHSRQELAQRIIEAVGENLINPNLYDLSNDEDRAVLKTAVELEIELYKCDTLRYPVSRLSTLREAILILAFYGCDAHKKLLAGEFSTIAGMQPLLKVEKWEQKWECLAEAGFDLVYRENEDATLNFTAEESLHVFVESIRVPVKSEFMSKTKTAVIDAPGTMANLRDTMRALKSASEAAIILFVLNGEKEFNEEEKNQLRTLRDAGMADKVIFALNFNKPPQAIRNTTESAILSVLRQEGYTAPHHQNLLYYNAYLAMHVFQGEKILQGTLDDLSEQGLLTDLEKFGLKQDKDTVADAWKKTTAQVLMQIGSFQSAMKVQNMPLTPNGNILQVQRKMECRNILNEIRAISRWDEMIFSLRSHILKNRSAGVLLDLGTRPVIKALENIEKILKQREDTSERSRDAIEARHKEAKDILDKFSTAANAVLSKEFSAEIDNALAQDYFNEVLLGSVDDAAESAAPKIFDATGILENIGNAVGGFFTKVGNLFRDKDKKKHHVTIEEQCNNIVIVSYKDSVTKKSTRWSKNLDQNNSTYKYHVRQTVQKVQRDLRSIWGRLKLANNKLLDNIDPIPESLTGSLQTDVQSHYLQVSDIATTTARARYEVWSGATYIASSFGTLGAMGYLLSAVIFAIPGISWIFGIGAGIVGWITTAIFNDNDEEIAAIKDKIAASLRSNFSAKASEIQQAIVNGNPPESPGVKSIREFYVDLFKHKIDEQKDALDAEYKRMLAELELSTEERERIKLKAEKIRTDKITPLRADVAAVEQEIADILRGEERAQLV